MDSSLRLGIFIVAFTAVIAGFIGVVAILALLPWPVNCIAAGLFVCAACAAALAIPE